MHYRKIAEWLDDILEAGKFNDVSNNGIQIEREGEEASLVAFAVDASKESVLKAAEAGAQMLVVHHGISWGGGIARIAGAEYEVVKAAIANNIALYASHLPLDASEKVGNNWELARLLGLKAVEKAFSYHGNVIGLAGELEEEREVQICENKFIVPAGKIAVCSGGGAAFAVEAKALGCKALLTGEADWGETIAAENVDMKLILAGHYETETFGVMALSKLLASSLGIATCFIPRGPIKINMV